MLFSEFLKHLVQDISDAKDAAVKHNEEHRKSHYEENDDGHLEHKTTTRIHHGEPIEIPEKTQHHVHDLLVNEVELETETNLYKSFGKLKTHVKKGLFSRGVHVKIKMKISAEDAPEGVHAQIDKLNDKLKENLQ